MVAVAKTRILQGSHLDVLGLSKGKTPVPMLHSSLTRIEADMR
jgi:hypothetical protein